MNTSIYELQMITCFMHNISVHNIGLHFTILWQDTLSHLWQIPCSRNQSI